MNDNETELLNNTIDAKVLKLNKKISKLNGDLKDLKQTYHVRCTDNIPYGKGCGTLSMIGDLTFIQTKYYIRPSGCAGGDYWDDGEGQFICPNCGHRNRLYDRKKIEDLKYFFHNIKDEYPEQ